MKWIKRMAGIIARLFIFVSIVCVLNYMCVDDYSDWGRFLWRSFYDEAGKIDNLYLGSSHVYCDLDPYQLDRLNGQCNFNLSSSSQPMNGTYFLLREADRYNELSHVYVELYLGNAKYDDGRDLMENRLISNWENTDHMKFSLNRLWYMITMAKSERYSDTFLRFSRYRGGWHNWSYVENIIEQKRGGRYLDYRGHWDYGDGNGYYEYRPKGQYYTTRVFPNTARFCNQSRHLAKNPMDEMSEEYLRKVIVYCQKRQIPITLFISPIYELQSISTEHYDYYLEQVREIAEEYGVELYDFNLAREEELPIQDTKYFMDEGHLNATGAELFTAFFHKVMSGDAVENQQYFYDTYEQKLAHTAPEVYGIYYRDEAAEEGDEVSIRNLFIASNRNEGMEYRVEMSPENDDPYLLQDYSENRAFQVEIDEHGTCAIMYRMKDMPDAVQEIEITY